MARRVTHAVLAGVRGTEPGPWDPQGIHRLEHPDGQVLDIFIVPLGPDAESGGMRYEAVFA